MGVFRPFRLKTAHADWMTCRCAFVPAGLRHALHFAGNVHGKLFVERDSADFLYFRRRYAHREGGVSYFNDAETIDCFRYLYEADPEKAIVAAHIDRLLGCGPPLPSSIDPRVVTAMDLLRGEPDRNFSHCFRDTFGVNPAFVFRSLNRFEVTS
ncbi:MAG: hypothetical protein ACPW60_13505 [Methylohalobius sp. ZOD2]